MRHSIAFALLSLTASTVAFVDCTGGSSTTTTYPPLDGGPIVETSTTPKDGGPDSPTAPAPDSGPNPDASACGGAAGMLSCNGTCKDVQTDTANCGSCGHDCLGASCMAGQCQATVLAILPTGTKTAYLATDGTNVVWTSVGAGTPAPGDPQGGAYYVSATGASQTAIALEPLPNSNTYDGPIAMAGGTAFWMVSSGGTSYDYAIPGQVAKNGNGGLLSKTALAASGNVVVSANDTGANVDISTFNANTPQTILAAHQFQTMAGLAGLATDGTNAYYATGANLMSVPLATLGPNATEASFVASPGSPRQIVVAGSNLFFADGSSNTFYQAPIPNPTQTKSVVFQDSMAATCTGLAADSNYIYFTDGGTSVFYAPIAGGMPTVLAKGMAPTAIAIDAKALYFIDAPAANLNKVALPAP
jgi:hypothetical protein